MDMPVFGRKKAFPRGKRVRGKKGYAIIMFSGPKK
jgi:hypothetical protein